MSRANNHSNPIPTFRNSQTEMSDEITQTPQRGAIMPLPSDPAELTAEHVAALNFNTAALRDVVRMAMGQEG